MTDPVQQQFRTPKGNTVSLWVREGTNDADICRSVMTEDEYGLADLTLTRWCWDVGAHIGAVTVAILADNPEASVVAVEPVAENLALLERNTASYFARVVAVEAAAAGPGAKAVDIGVRYSGNEAADRHTWIANQPMAAGTHSEVRTVRALADPKPLPLPQLVVIDCEGCEYDFLHNPWLRQVPLVIGEYHRGAEPIAHALPHHMVTFSGDDGVGLFRARIEP